MSLRKKTCLYPGWLRLLPLAALLSMPGFVHAAVSVDGTLTIPFPAPAGGVTIEVYLEDTDSFSVTYQQFVVNESNSAVSYSLSNSGFTSATVRYSCLTNCGDIYPDGYVTASGTSYKWSAAQIFTGTNPGMDIGLPLGYRVNGQIRLPGTDKAATDISFDVNAYDNDSSTVTATGYIPTGGSAHSYSLLLPPAVGQQWLVEYEITAGNQNKYFPAGYSAGAATTYIIANAQKLSGSQAYAGIDLTLLVARTITGSVALPDGKTAPAGGMEVIMYTRDRYGWGGDDSMSVTIPEGGSSTAYTLLMPYTTGNSWGVRYACRNYYCGGGQYLNLGYYAGAAAPTAYSDPGYSLSGQMSHANINLTLIKARTIAGKVSLPEPAPANGLFLQVEAYDPSPVVAAFTSSSFTIPQGGTASAYSIQVPDDSALSWRVNYRIFTYKPGYIPLGYYTKSGTTHIEGNGTLLAGGADYSGINLTAIPDRDNDGIPDSLDPVNNQLNPGVLLLLRKSS